MVTKITTVLVGAALWSQSAMALDCWYGVNATNISEGQEVPTNFQPMIWQSQAELQAEIRDMETSEVIAATLEEVTQEAYRLTPEAELEAGRSYGLYVVELEEWTAEPIVSFTAASESDMTAPDAPVIESATRDFGSDEWGSWKWIDIGVEAPGEAVGGAYEVEVSANEDFSDAELALVPASEDLLKVGSGLCEQSLSMAVEDIRWVRVTAIDHAGNRSEEASESFEVDLSSSPPEEPGGPDDTSGCQMAASPASLGALLLGLPLFFRRRR